MEKLNGRSSVDQVAQIKRSVEMLKTLRAGIADANSLIEFETWQVIAMAMLDDEVRNLETVNADLEKRFDLGEFAGMLYD